MHCNDANAILTRLRYAGTYAAAIAGRYYYYYYYYYYYFTASIAEGLLQGCNSLIG